jgi:OFA family oxalate/formate antiporter-like MFS transporter
MAETKGYTSVGKVVVLAGVGINLCLGVLYTWSMFTSALTGKLAWTAAEALTPYAIALGVFGVTMVFAGRLQDRIGPRVAATVGGVLVGAGMVVASLAPKADAAAAKVFGALSPIAAKAATDAAVKASFEVTQTAAFAAAKATLVPAVGQALPWLIVGFGILTGAGIGFAYAAATPAAVKWFAPTKKGLISGTVVAGFGLASVYTAPLTGNLLATAGADPASSLNNTFLYLGLGFFVAIIVFAQFLRNPLPGYMPPADRRPHVAAAVAKGPARDYTWQEMVRTPQFWLMWVMYAIAAGAGLMVVGIIAKYAQGIPSVLDQLTGITEGFKGGGLDWVAKAGATFTFVMALAVGNGAGRPITGIVSDRIGRTKTMMAVFTLQALLMALLASGLVVDYVVLLVVGAFVGAMYGANLTLFPSMCYDFFGTKNGAVNYGLVFTAWGAGGVLGSIGSGFARDFFGNFNTAFWVAAALLVVATAVAAFVKAPQEAPGARTVLEPAEAGA